MTTALALRSYHNRLTAVRPAAVRDTEAIAATAVQCLLVELETWPKPGLVSHVDTGSHSDMDAGTFRRSAAAIQPYFQALADAGAQGCGMGRLRVIGLEAEAAMFAATAGINTHRGVIFGLGLLCAAAGAASSGRTDFGNAARRRRCTAVGPRYSGRARAAAQSRRRGTQALWSRRRPVGGVPWLPERLRGRLTSAQMRHPARARRCRSGARASMFCSHCRSARHQSSAPRGPVRPRLCPVRRPRLS